MRDSLSGTLAAQRAGLLYFACGSRHPLGFARLDELGRIDPAAPVELWVTCRMTHVAALGALAREQSGPSLEVLNLLAEHGVHALRTNMRDAIHGGWFAAVGANGPVDSRKQAYGHAFVILAASSASLLGISGAQDLLDEALAVHLDHFWDEDEGMSVEDWNAQWSALEDYRGVNANMHTVEAQLAAGEASGDDRWFERAGRITARVAEFASRNEWRIPEHFDSQWRPLLEHNRLRPDDPFRPYGATVGHGFEWSRLMLTVVSALGERAPSGLTEAARSLYDRAAADGWAVDGAPGFVYTTDWTGRAVVRARMHWVLAEALNAACAMSETTGEARYVEDWCTWWRFAETRFIDAELGSWHHELDEKNQPAASVWSGKPDVYHAYQACLMPALPLAPSFAGILARRGGLGATDAARVLSAPEAGRG